jgi:hypothetical protein
MLFLLGNLINLSFALLLFFLTVAFVTGAPFVPSTPKVTARMINFAGIKPGMVIYDLGSGDGRLLFAAAKLGAKATGYEINPFLVFLTYLRIIFSPQRRLVKVVWKNFWKADIHDADGVFVYLLPWKMQQLAAKLTHELQPGTKIISNSFIFPGWKINQKDEQLHVYEFKIPMSSRA